LFLERLLFQEKEGTVGFRYRKDEGEQETMDDLEFIARVTSHIAHKGQVTVRDYGLYADAHRGKKEFPFLLCRLNERSSTNITLSHRRG